MLLQPGQRSASTDGYLSCDLVNGVEAIQSRGLENQFPGRRCRGLREPGTAADDYDRMPCVVCRSDQRSCLDGCSRSVRAFWN